MVVDTETHVPDPDITVAKQHDVRLSISGRHFD